jgi:response regulator RpfG family c-di-GMP phosphodiesterase
MAETESIKRVLVINTNLDTVELLRLVLEDAGFVVLSGFVDELKRGELDLRQLLMDRPPHCLLFDIAPPYDRQWRFLQTLREHPLLVRVPLVVTSTNPKRAKEQAATDTDILEIIGKPYDLDQILGAVRHAIDTKAVRAGGEADR